MAERDTVSSKHPLKFYSIVPSSTAHPGQNDATAIIPVSTSVVVSATPSHAVIQTVVSHAIILAAAFKAIDPAASS